MGAGPHVRRLGPGDALALVALRRQALDEEPLAFAASVEDDRGLSLDVVRTALADNQGQAIFGYFSGADLSGMVGILRSAAVKRRHTCTVWGMYVAPRARERGAGRALLNAAVEQARRWPGVEQVQLTVSDTAAAARRLYERTGFRSWGREPAALRWRGRSVDDHHLVLDLRAGSCPRTRGAATPIAESGSREAYNRAVDGVHVRRLAPHEADLHRDVRLRALREAADAFADTFADAVARPMSYWDELTRSVTAPDRHAMFLACAGDSVVGSAYGLCDPEESRAGRVGGMWVDPEWRRRGIGTALLQTVLAWARERGFTRLGLWAPAHRPEALALYRGARFVETGRRRSMSSNSDREIIEMESVA
jgi:ribosomal protein S18 acetylase RimI-like enzyme